MQFDSALRSFGCNYLNSYHFNDVLGEIAAIPVNDTVGIWIRKVDNKSGKLDWSSAWQIPAASTAVPASLKSSGSNTKNVRDIVFARRSSYGVVKCVSMVAIAFDSWITVWTLGDVSSKQWDLYKTINLNEVKQSMISSIHWHRCQIPTIIVNLTIGSPVVITLSHTSIVSSRQLNIDKHLITKSPLLCVSPMDDVIYVSNISKSDDVMCVRDALMNKDELKCFDVAKSKNGKSSSSSIIDASSVSLQARSMHVDADAGFLYVSYESTTNSTDGNMMLLRDIINKNEVTVRLPNSSHICLESGVKPTIEVLSQSGHTTHTASASVLDCMHTPQSSVAVRHATIKSMPRFHHALAGTAIQDTLSVNADRITTAAVLLNITKTTASGTSICNTGFPSNSIAKLCVYRVNEGMDGCCDATSAAIEKYTSISIDHPGLLRPDMFAVTGVVTGAAYTTGSYTAISSSSSSVIIIYHFDYRTKEFSKYLELNLSTEVGSSNNKSGTDDVKCKGLRFSHDGTVLFAMAASRDCHSLASLSSSSTYSCTLKSFHFPQNKSDVAVTYTAASTTSSANYNGNDNVSKDSNSKLLERLDEIQHSMMEGFAAISKQLQQQQVQIDSISAKVYKLDK